MCMFQGRKFPRRQIITLMSFMCLPIHCVVSYPRDSSRYWGVKCPSSIPLPKHENHKPTLPFGIHLFPGEPLDPPDPTLTSRSFRKIPFPLLPCPLSLTRSSRPLLHTITPPFYHHKSQFGLRRWTTKTPELVQWIGGTLEWRCRHYPLLWWDKYADRTHNDIHVS